MKAYTSPTLVTDNTVTYLKRVSFGSAEDNQFQYNETWLQDFLFKHYLSIPTGEIDKTFSSIVPICRELTTPAGPLDVLYVTPEGKLVILEAKLWRNPEARRKVIAQVLDYAKEFNRWSYEDLQREVSKATKQKGNVLYDLVKEKHPDIDEADFVDEVSRSMERGDFLLLIVGDGIREGAQNIAEFMNTIGRLQFTLGLIEVSMYKLPDQSLLVQPRVLAKTTILERAVVELKQSELVIINQDDTSDSPDDDSEQKSFYTETWKQFIQQLQLDDVGLPMSENPTAQNFYLYPATTRLCWISAYFMNSKNRVGVYFRTQKSDYGDDLYDYLLSHREAIGLEIGQNALWKDEGPGHPKSISVYQEINNVLSESNRPIIFEFFNDNLNKFVNALRPLIKKFENQRD